MSSTPVEEAAPDERRVRERAREAVILMGFSLATAVVLTLGLLGLSRLGY